MASADGEADVELLFDHFPALKAAANRELVEIVADAVDHGFDTDQRFLYIQGEPITHLFLVIEGNVEERQITAPDATDQAVMKRVVGPGTLLGLYDLFYGQRYSTRGRKLGNATVVALRAVAIERLIYRFPALRTALAPLPIIERLRTMPLLAHVNPVALGFIADATTITSWAIGAQIFDSGETAEWIYLIDQGQVRLEWDDQQPETLLANGSTVGFLENGLESLTPPAFSYRAVATIPTAGYQIRRSTLADIVDFDVDQRARDQRAAVTNTLEQLPLFRTFELAQRRRLSGFVSHYVIPINHLIMQQGEMNDSLWILLPGQRARIHALDATGQALQSTGAEGVNYFGEVALRAQVPVDSTIEAEAGSQWLRLHHLDLDVLSAQEGTDLAGALTLR
ncbi:MAG: cyclic nucleotide-binding domain-containing protein, partial [Caldilineaceae bacterium]|nr:cyclic nucleotide-binding domain-containing protein [Caldilineaceae bacterium]